MNYTHEYRRGTSDAPRLARVTGERSQDGRVWAILVSNTQPVPKDWVTRVDETHVKRLVDRKHLRKIGGE